MGVSDLTFFLDALLILPKTNKQNKNESAQRKVKTRFTRFQSIAVYKRCCEGSKEEEARFKRDFLDGDGNV